MGNVMWEIAQIQVWPIDTQCVMTISDKGLQKMTEKMLVHFDFAGTEFPNEEGQDWVTSHENVLIFLFRTDVVNDECMMSHSIPPSSASLYNRHSSAPETSTTW